MLPFRSLQHQGVGEGATPFPGLLHFTLDPYLIMLSVKQGSIKYHFLSMTRPGIDPRSPGPLTNCLYYVLETSIDIIKENGFTLKRQEADDIRRKL